MRIYLAYTFLVILMVSACTFTQKVRTGTQAFEVKQYSVATELFQEEYEATKTPSDRARLAFLTGESYKYMQDHGSAGNWYQKAYEDGYGEKALEAHANSLKYQQRYEEALKAYEDLLQLSPGNASYRSNITLVKQAMEWSRTPNSFYKVKPAPFNSTGSDYAPHPIGAGQIIFTSDRESKQTTETYLWTGRAFSDVFVTNKFSEQVTAFDPTINTDDNEGTAVISPDGNVLVFTRCFVDDAYDAWCKLMISFSKGQMWSTPEVLPFVKEKVNYGHPAFAANGSTLFFSSDAPEGQGGHDIYFVQPDGAGGWSEPVNLGPRINTIGEEQYPTVYKDSLFYSSDHLPGLGGLDIFKTYLDQQDEWVAPINLRSPINSGADDFGFVVDTFSSLAPGVMLAGYFTTSRDGYAKNDEIYSFEMMGLSPEDVIALQTKKDTVEKVPEINYQVFLALRVVEPVFSIPDDPNSTVTGRNPLPNGPVLLTANGQELRYTTDEQGQLLVKLDWNKDYVITARYRDHLSGTHSLNTSEVVKNADNPITTINHVLVLDPIFRDKEIVLENIFYDYDEWFIRDDAKPSLNELSAILKNNPSIRIQLSSHTDCRGTDEYNLDLSQKRAQAAIDYLISVGIAPGRLTAQGFGESNLAVRCEDCDNCSEEIHQKNRRTTFKIIN